MIFMETTPSAVNEAVKNEHIISLQQTLREHYLLLSHKQDTSSQTHPWQSKKHSTSALTQQQDHLTSHSLRTPRHTTTALIQLLEQTSISPDHHLRPSPTNLTLKTYSTLSLPMQTTIFNNTNVANLDVCTNPQTPLHLSSTVMKS